MRGTAVRALGRGLAVSLVALLAMPFVALLLDARPGDLDRARAAGVTDALLFSAGTAVVATGLVLALGTPLAWWIARRPGQGARVTLFVVRLAQVSPPAVTGVALLAGVGEGGLVPLPLGATAAVVLAQVVVAAPWFVLPVTRAFREVDPELLLVARGLGASPARAFLRVAVPMSSRAISDGLAIAWARAVGELGAVLVLGAGIGAVTLPVAIATELQLGTVRAMAVLLLALALGGALILRSRLAARSLGSDA